MVHTATHNHYYFTSHGLHKFRKELRELREHARHLAKHLHDLVRSEAPEDIADYYIDHEHTEARARELSYILDRARLAPTNHSIAEVGSTVCLKDNQHEWHIVLVNPLEADPSANLIAIDSPLGNALLGKRAGEVARVQTPRLNRAFVIAYVR